MELSGLSSRYSSSSSWSFCPADSICVRRMASSSSLPVKPRRFSSTKRTGSTPRRSSALVNGLLDLTSKRSCCARQAADCCSASRCSASMSSSSVTPNLCISKRVVRSMPRICWAFLLFWARRIDTSRVESTTRSSTSCHTPLPSPSALTRPESSTPSTTLSFSWDSPRVSCDRRWAPTADTCMACSTITSAMAACSRLLAVLTYSHVAS
mmetsp:Transcript_19883/g.76195  ORF Transcript_19883/g.76195 Transcript_19883/m.76195 type:complete len:210 (+) Transcript_19883:813-1442(+)